MKLKIKIFFLGFLLAINAFALFYIFTGGITGFAVNNGPISPHDIIYAEDIIANNASVTIFIDNPILSRYESTGSMIPLISETATGVGVKPSSEKDVRVGDVVSFVEKGKLIVHRIVETGIDSEGTYFITKGDNNFGSDSKVRYWQIESILVAIIY